MFLKDKVSLVTGAGRGIGKAIALGLARQGSTVVVNDIDATGIRITTEQIRALGVHALEALADVSNYAAVRAMVQDTVQRLGHLDVLVNNAGILSTGLIEEVDPEEWDRVMNINLKGVFNACKACLEVMLPQGSGKIVNLASIAAHRRGPIANTIYATSKAGVVSFTRGLAKEVAPRGINVNAIAPGIIETDMTQDFLSKFTPQDLVRNIPLGRIGKPDDVMELLLFLVSDRAEFITGEVVALDGGFSI
jgi:3-oxoacyl-[acyl-carrier protein] reductase